MGVEDLQAGIERRLEDLSEQAERLRAALDALASVDPAPARSTTRTARAAALGARSRHALTRRVARAKGARTEGASGAKRPGSPTSLSRAAASAAGPVTESEDALSQLTAAGPAVDAGTGGSTVSVTGAERALYDLRCELTAGLRTGRS